MERLYEGSEQTPAELRPRITGSLQLLCAPFSALGFPKVPENAVTGQRRAGKSKWPQNCLLGQVIDAILTVSCDRVVQLIGR